MSVITTLSTKHKAASTNREVSEFDGLWINAGVNIGDEADPKFVRLPRGIPVSDLKPRKIYESMDADFAGEVAIINSVIAQIQTEASKLAEGESKAINLELRLYRRQEESEVAPDIATDETLHKALFSM